MIEKKWVSLRTSVAKMAHSSAVVHIGISKRVEPLAVQRNRVKRLVREVLRGLTLTVGQVYWLKIERVPARLEYKTVETALLEVFK